MLHDPYERVNVWSHGVPGVFFLLVGLYGLQLGINAYAVFGLCAATTHLLSALTHVYPDSVPLEKMDHYGIVALCVGTTASALLAGSKDGQLPSSMIYITLGLAVAAALRPLPRVLGYAAGVAAFVLLYGPQISNANLWAQIAMYAVGGWCFLRNGGHSDRPYWLADHHILHYQVSASCCLHMFYIRDALQAMQ